MPQKINNGVNVFDQDVWKQHGRNLFDLSHDTYFTSPYGVPMPSLCIPTIPDDVIRVKSNPRFLTPSIDHPIFSGLHVKEDTYHVPLSILIPRTWERFITVPLVNSDLPEDSLPQFQPYILLSRICNIVSQISTNEDEEYIILLNAIALRNWFGPSSLADMMGVRIDFPSRFWTSLDEWILSVLTRLYSTLAVESLYDSPYFAFLFGNSHNAYEFASLFTQTILDSTFVDRFDIDYSEIIDSPLVAAFIPDLNAVIRLLSPTAIIHIPLDTTFVSLLPFAAYRSIASSYYSNDSVDAVYSWNLALQDLEGYILDTHKPSTFFEDPSSHAMVIYDTISWHYFNLLDPHDSYDLVALNFFFGYCQSLKWGDYFTSANVKPLAGTDYKDGSSVSIPVNNGSNGSYVSVFDTRKALTMQRFLNIVNRVGARVKDYTKSIFGVSPNEIGLDIPQFLSRVQYDLSVSETPNTADQQGKITSRGSSMDSQYLMEYHTTNFGFLISLCHMNGVTSYSGGIERKNMMLDRFDLFNPAIEDLGDQEIFHYELGCSFSNPISKAPFGYINRYSQYKNVLNKVHGQFSISSINSFTGINPTALRPYVMVYDGLIFSYTDDGAPISLSIDSYISPSFIRSKCTDISPLLASDTQLYLSKIHYMARINYDIKASRKINYRIDTL